MIILTNIYPTSLVRRPVKMTPITTEEAKEKLKSGFLSCWGHTNTIGAANKMLGIDVTPKQERPAIVLDETKMPTLHGEKAELVIVLSPVYKAGFRPKIGEEVDKDKIAEWQAIKVEFTNAV